MCIRDRHNFKYEIKKIDNVENFELKSFILRSYYHNNILAFGDLLHRIHPLAGQGFNMTIRDINCLISIIQKKIELNLKETFISYGIWYTFKTKVRGNIHIHLHSDT